MPIYEYRCPHCGHQFETMHAVNATPPKCERCGRAVRRVFTPVGIIFKGSGWHITDYRKTPAPVDGEGKKSETAPSGGASSDGATSGGGAAAEGAAAAGGTKSSRGGKSDGGAKSDGRAKSGGAGSKSASRSGGGGRAS